MKCQDAIENRFSCREYSNKKVHWPAVLEAIDAANHTPFAGNINNLKFVIVQDQKTIQKLTESCQQDWINDSSYVVVVCADSGVLEEHYDSHGKNYSKQQAGAAIQNFLLRITDLGLGSCWVGAFVENQVRRVLKIPEKYDIEALLPIGTPTHKKPKLSKKASISSKIFWDEWDQKRKPTGFKDPRS